MESLTNFITEWQNKQIHIYRHLIDKHFYGFTIVSDDQWTSIEKQFQNNGKWVNIEIEDAESLEEVDHYVVCLQQHNSKWLPSCEEEEQDTIPITSVICNSVEEVMQTIELWKNE